MQCSKHGDRLLEWREKAPQRKRLARKRSRPDLPHLFVVVDHSTQLEAIVLQGV